MADMAHPIVAAKEARERGDLDFLLRLLVDTDPLIRSAAAQNLGQMGDAIAVGPLVRCLSASDEGLQISALKALGKIGDRSAISDVYEVASGDQSFGVRATAAETLGVLGDPRATRLIGSMLNERDSPYPRGYRKWAARELVRLRGIDSIPDLEAAKSHAGLLGRRQLEKAISALKKLEPQSYGEGPPI